MNIFEALEKGNGKATITGNLNLYYVVYENGRFHARSIGLPVWLLPQEVPYSALQHNDWIPYVPPEERSTNEETSKTTDSWTVYDWLVNKLRMQGFKEDLISKMLVKPDVPRGTCSNCGFPSTPGSGRMVKLTPDYKCVECGRGDIFEVVSPSKHKEVFENVIWIKKVPWGQMYPYFHKNPDVFEKLENKRTKVTLEWEE